MNYSIEPSDQPLIILLKQYLAKTRYIKSSKYLSRKSYAAKFFDHVMQCQGAKKSMKFLNEMKKIIPFKHLVSILIEEGIYKPELGRS